MDLGKTNHRANLRESANILSKIFYWWLLPLFRKGWQNQNLTMDDLCNAPQEDEADKLSLELATAWENECQRTKKLKNGHPKLYKALLKVHWKRYAASVFLSMVDELVIRIFQPILLYGLVSTFSNEAELSKNYDKYYYGIGILLTIFGHSLFFHSSIFGCIHIGMKCRLAVSSLIYNKTLRFSKAAQGQSMGQRVNLIAIDVNRFEINLAFIPYLIIAPVQLCIFIYLLYTKIGWSCFAGPGLMTLFVVMQCFGGFLLSKFRFEISKRTDARSQMMSEIIGAIRLIKVYAWEKPFSVLIHDLRRLEIKALRKAMYLRAIILSLFYSTSNLVTFFTVCVYVTVQGGELTAQIVFMIIVIHNVLRGTLVYITPSAVTQASELFVAINRIESFLLLDDDQASPGILKPAIRGTADNIFEKEKENNCIKIPSIVMTDACARWTDAVRATIDKFSLNLSGDKIVMVVGPVGSGKTSFLHALLSELPISEGKCAIKGETAYASQEPWIFSGHVRQNILFGRPYDPTRYDRVVEAAALRNDLKQLTHGDQTLVGERGVALSGGQKARLSLARALYQQADIYLLDDPLSAVDAMVGPHIFEKGVCQFLNGKLRILVTHQLQFLSQAHHVIVLNQGTILAQGTYLELFKSGVDLASLVGSDDNNGDDGISGENKESVLKEPNFGQSKQQNGPEQKGPQLPAEKVASGSVGGTIWRYVLSGDSIFGLIVLGFSFIISQSLSSIADYWLSYWTTQIRNDRKECESHKSGIDLFANSTMTINNDDDPCADSFDNQNYLYIYTGLSILTFVTMEGKAVYFFKYCLDISVNIHRKMFASLIRAPTKFFDDNPAGRIMNRFSKDLAAMDESLMPAFFDTLSILCIFISTLVLVSYLNYVVIIPALLFVVLLILLRTFYLRTTRHVKRLEAMNRSPIFSHLVSTIQGLTTVRSSGTENILKRQFNELQNIHSSAWFIFIQASRGLGFWIDMISLIFVAVTMYSFLAFSGWFGGSQVGLAISSVLGIMGISQFGMKQSTECENHMTSVERNFEYTNLEPEAPCESEADKKPPAGWPTHGQITFDTVSLAYEAGIDILRDLTFDIRPQEKIGIVGRTGAGKSSIIAALFRMTEPRGDITIDGVRVNDIGLHDLRRNISIIPQDPHLFSGTVRYNLDPFGQFPDDQLWKVIEKVKLKEAILALDFQVADGGSNFSVGERQLVCLGRAILRQNRIIVMDEATANVDAETDNFIQHTIREKFANCTIITIAHRLHSVIDCDKILVMENGQLKEYDHPHILLQNPNGLLSSMVNHTGKTNATMLLKVANETYADRRKAAS